MIDAAERALLEATVRAAIDGAVDGGTSIDDVLADLGWLDMLTAAPSDAIAVVFGALGATNGTATALDDVVVSALGLQARPDLAVVLPRFASSEAPGRSDDGGVHARGLATERATTANEIVVVCNAGAQVCVVPTDEVELTGVRGIDPEGRLLLARIETGVTAGATTLQVGAWDAAVALGRRALAHQIAGASRAMLDLACAHAVERVQFGRPIARFQAVRHRLADALVAVEALDSVLAAASDEPNALTAALAKAVAGRTSRTVAKHCQQVLAGIGFTTDHPFHRFLKRTMSLEGLFGSVDEIVVDVGRQLLESRRVPTLIEL